MKAVALVGFAENTRAAVRQSKADEIWSLNWAYKYDFIPRIDRLFEMHPVWVYGKSPKEEHSKMANHWIWLQSPRPYPIYMLAQIPQVPACVRYPIEAVTASCFGERLTKGGKPSDFYGSSFDYMIALAIHEGFDVIELYGMEMGSESEYRYQRESAAFFIGLAISKGIAIKLQPETVLLRGKRYGYEGGQMIFRQDLERMLNQWNDKANEASARLQYCEGQLDLLKEKGTPEEIEEANKKCTLARDDWMIAAGGQQLLVYQIRSVDLEEPILELYNPINRIAPV